ASSRAGCSPLRPACTASSIRSTTSGSRDAAAGPRSSPTPSPRSLRRTAAEAAGGRLAGRRNDVAAVPVGVDGESVPVGRRRYALLQHLQIGLLRHLGGAELAQMLGDELRVEQGEATP